MKTPVAISPGELVRILAHAVLSRPENAGRICAAVEMHQDVESAGLVGAKVVLFDSEAEAREHVAGPAPAKGAPTLSVVTPPAEVPGAP